MMRLWASYKKKIWKKYFFCILKITDPELVPELDPDPEMDPELGSGYGAGSGSISQRYGSGDPDPDPHQNGTDPQHCFAWIRHWIEYPTVEMVWSRTNHSNPQLIYVLINSYSIPAVKLCEKSKDLRLNKCNSVSENAQHCKKTQCRENFAKTCHASMQGIVVGTCKSRRCIVEHFLKKKNAYKQ
jgi:hypothetical protein